MLFFCSASSAFSSEKVVLHGFVIITKDNNGKVVEAKVVTEGQTIEMYPIVLNTRGMNLIREMQGRQVEVIGNLVLIDDDYWIEVENYQKENDGELWNLQKKDN